jgi:hypothetical protein
LFYAIKNINNNYRGVQLKAPSGKPLIFMAVTARVTRECRSIIGVRLARWEDGFGIWGSGFKPNVIKLRVSD